VKRRARELELLQGYILRVDGVDVTPEELLRVSKLKRKKALSWYMRNEAGLEVGAKPFLFASGEREPVEPELAEQA
jgi:hypothetical protein